MITARPTPFMRIGAIALTLACSGFAMAQADAPKLAPAYQGGWDNLEGPISGTMRITIAKVDADGSVEGRYWRDSKYCSAEGIAMKGKLEGATLALLPDFSSDAKCKDTSWAFEVQPDGSLKGQGASYFRLKALLKPAAP